MAWRAKEYIRECKEMRALVLLSVLLAGCNTLDYGTYADAQVKLSRDAVIQEAAYMQTLLEMSRSPDPTIRAIAAIQLQKLPERKRVTLNPPGQPQQ